MGEAKVILRAKRAQILESYGHPWVFSKGLAGKIEAAPGTQVRVVSQDGKHLGWAFYHPHNPIALRMISHEKTAPDRQSWRDRLATALALRKATLPAERKNYRLVHGENDGFPGLTVDIFGSLATMQVNTAGFEGMKRELAEDIVALTGVSAVYERSEGHARKQEGLASARGFLVGELDFPITISEDGFTYQVDPSRDQKTGFFLDQYPQRHWLEARCKDLRVLDLCCYTGGFTLAALRGGAAHVTSVDSSKRALEQLTWSLAESGLDGSRQESREADIFDMLKHREGETYDVVVLDPPALAKTIKMEERARMAYRQLNRDAASWLNPGGLLMTFSCSGVVNAEVFGRSVFLGLRDAKRTALQVARFGPGPDHPVNLCFPEGAYLKGLALYLP